MTNLPLFIFAFVYTLWIPLTILKYIAPGLHKNILDLGVSHDFLQTTFVNSRISYYVTLFGQKFSKLLTKFYSLGACLCILCSFISMFYFIFNIFTFFGSFFFNQLDKISKESQHMAILVPGLTIPFSDIPILATSLLFAAIFHELGHALSSTSENVGIYEFGLNFYIFLPSAFVEISFDDLEKKGSFQKLKIFTAGAFHNIIMGFITLLIFLFLFQATNNSIVANIKENSPLNSHLHLGDTLEYLNGEKINQNWVERLKSIKKNNLGYCLDRKDFNIQNDANCCENDDSNLLCILHKEEKGCISAKLLNSKPKCSESCELDQICVRTHEILFEIKASGHENPILYYGTIQSLYNEGNLLRFKNS